MFTDSAYFGNPVAVVLDGSGLSTEEMQLITRWMNLSETTFVLPPTSPEADYHVRIFTISSELPFAGHPTLGTCHAWLGSAAATDKTEIVQECGAGLLRIRRTGDEGSGNGKGSTGSNGSARLSFAAPPLIRYESAEEDLVAHAAEVLAIDRSEILDAQWVDNGPGWVAVLLRDAKSVLALRPGYVDIDLGVVGPYQSSKEMAFEVRAFFPKDGSTTEDPVTGSLNASLAKWLFETGRAPRSYIASQGTALGRRGRVYVDIDDEGTIWVGGGTITCISGEIEA